LVSQIVFSVTLLAAMSVQAMAQQVSVAPYYGGRLAALSLTFDDGLQDQYTLAFPDDLCGRQELLWIAPHRDVAAYVRERDDVRLTVTPTADGYRVKLATTLNPKIFNHPLTLEVHTPLCHATQDGKSLAIKRVKDVAYVDVNPYGGEVMLRK
jgi:hypothetical protein